MKILTWKSVILASTYFGVSTTAITLSALNRTPLSNIQKEEPKVTPFLPQNATVAKTVNEFELYDRCRNKYSKPYCISRYGAGKYSF